MEQDLSTLRCANCGSPDTSSLIWVHNLTNELEDFMGSRYEEECNFCNECNKNTELLTLPELWEKFSDVPINNDDQIETSFLHFPAGTYRFDVWHWFDERCPNGLAKDLCP